MTRTRIRLHRTGRRAGMLLAELMVTVGLMTLVLGMVMVACGAAQRTATRAERVLDDLSAAALDLRHLKTDVRGAAAVLESLQVSGTEYASGAHTLVLALGDGGRIVYRKADSGLRRVEVGRGEVRSAESRPMYKAVTFSYDTPRAADARFVSVTVELRPRSLRRTKAVTPLIRTGAALRNRGRIP